ncbi:MAG: SLC13 family permease [Acidobacteriota bacterium]
MTEITLVLVLVAVALVLFVTEAIRVDVVGLTLIVAVVALGLCPAEEAVAGFSNPALLTIAAMFVLSAGLIRTDALAAAASWLIHFSRGGSRRLVLVMMIVATVMSAFITNTTVVVIFIPVIIGIAQEFGRSPSRFLLPLSYASIFGGSCTLIGTSTNLLVSSLAVSAGLGAIGMFELAPVGLMFVAVGTLYMMTIGRRLLPERRPVSATISGSTAREYLTEVQVRAGSSLIGQAIGDSVLAAHPDLGVLQIVRGEQIVWPPLDREIIKEDDVLMIRGKVETLVSVQSSGILQILPELTRGQIRFDPKATTLAEVVILPNSSLIGVRVGDARFRRLYGVTVMALQRRGAHFRDKVTRMDLRPGDILLVYGDERAIDDLKHVDEFVVLERPRVPRRDKSRALWSLVILVAVVLLAATGLSSILMASLGGALAMLLCGCVRPKEAYAAIDFRVLMLIAGALALARAIERTGAAALLADQVLAMAGHHGPRMTMALVYLLTMLTTEILSNNAAAVIAFPVAISAAHTLGADPRPFIMAVTFAASASFATPIGYQTNTLVYGAGGYRFADFLRVGSPLSIAFFIIAVVAIPWMWPF